MRKWPPPYVGMPPRMVNPALLFSIHVCIYYDLHCDSLLLRALLGVQELSESCNFVVKMTLYILYFARMQQYKYNQPRHTHKTHAMRAGVFLLQRGCYIHCSFFFDRNILSLLSCLSRFMVTLPICCSFFPIKAVSCVFHVNSVGLGHARVVCYGCCETSRILK